MIVFIFLSVIMMIFSFIVTKKIEEINQTYAFVNILLLTNYFILFTKSVFESLNVLYFSRDLKILLRMPIIPILITTLIILTIMRFTNVIKNKSKVMYLTIILAILILGFVTMSFNTTENISVSGFENVILQANGLAETIAEYFVLIKPIMSSLQNYNNIQGFQSLLIYLVENIICYGVIIFIVSKIYLKGVIGTIIIFMSLILLNLIGEKFKLFIDLKNPQISWDSEYTMMKQNTNVMYELFYTLVVVGILVFISNLMNNVIIFLSLTLIMLIVINTLINEHIHKKQNEIFKKLY